MTQDIEEIAIIGLSGAFPGALDIASLWRMLQDGSEGISCLTKDELLAAGENPSSLSDPAYVARGGFLAEAELFDPSFFGMSPAEAESIDPQQRLFLLHCYRALEDCGLDPSRITVPTGVFGGESQPAYWFSLKDQPKAKNLESFRAMLGNEKDFLATRVSYKLNLKGPSMTVQTACSSSLSAVALACQNLLSWNCDLALAGGATVSWPRPRGYISYEGMIHSPSGVCRPFDANADGTVFGEGVAVVCLKRLSEAIRDSDQIYAIIKAVALNNDGADKVGFTAPSIQGQAEAIQLAQELAGVSACDIGYIETHGTGTSLGDPIEIAALLKVFSKSRCAQNSCLLGSIKANIGHLDAAAGIASLIKTSLVLKTGIIPPQRNFDTPNPELRLESTPFGVNKKSVSWDGNGGQRIAGLSSFGIGGTNVHMILSSPPKDHAHTGHSSLQAKKLDLTCAAPYPFLLSAHSPKALSAVKQSLTEYLKLDTDVDLLALSAKIIGPRHPFKLRWACLSSSRSELLGSLTEAHSGPSFEQGATFLFPGQGSQFSGMAAAYYGVLPEFSAWIDKGIDIADRLGLHGFRDYLLLEGHDAAIQETRITQPLLYIMEFALAQEMIAAGLRPKTLLGHSVGEYAAAALADVFSFEDGLKLVASRSEWMQKAERGAMTAISLDKETLSAYLNTHNQVFLAVSNAATRHVLSGSENAIQELESALSNDNIDFNRLKTSHAFHSPLMDSIIAGFSSSLSNFTFRRPKIQILSNIDGKPISTDIDWPEYWKRQLRSPVRFDACVQYLKHENAGICLELGPRSSLSAFLALGGFDQEYLMPFLPPKKDHCLLFRKNLAKLWEYGFPIVFNIPTSSGLSLYPGYPFEMSTIGHGESQPPIPVHKQENKDQNDLQSQNHSLIVRRLWKEILGLEPNGADTNFIHSGADSFSVLRLIEGLRVNAGLSVSPQAIMQNPSYSGICSLLGRQEDTIHELAYVFPIQSGRGPSLFLVAGAHENRYSGFNGILASYEDDFYSYFSAMINSLGPDESLYGIKPKGLALGEYGHLSVESMAAAYIKSMRKIQTHGPYFIGGECVGGIVAYEMVRQLEAAGEKIGHLFLMDTPRPNTWVGIRENIIYQRRSILRGLKLLFFGHNLIGDSKLSSRLKRSLRNLIITLLPLSFKLRKLRRVLRGSIHYQRTLLRYRPKPINSPATLIVNKDWNGKWFMMGWTKEMNHSLHFYQVAGSHENRLKKSASRIGMIIKQTIRVYRE